MVTVILDDSQASQIAASATPVEVRDKRGAVIGLLIPGMASDDLVRTKESLEVLQTLVGEESLARAYGQHEPDYSECDLQP
jgi:hypothetical protein